MSLDICFRVDAATWIGTGHVMRCLTLADALRAGGAQCLFICRAHPGHLAEQISARGHQVHLLPALQAACSSVAPPAGAAVTHAHWLGVSVQQDSQETLAALAGKRPDWLIVDHYALDAAWESALDGSCQKLMVIDDLADRSHVADMLLDQTFSRTEADYNTLVSSGCKLLCGTDYALLRNDFVENRERSLARRRACGFDVHRLLVNMGGVDAANVTGRVLESLRNIALSEDVHITVVMGPKAPWLEEVQTLAQLMPHRVEVKSNVSDMATLMAASDLAIGAAGATSWERCCLGLPTIMLVLAENQKLVAAGLSAAGAVRVVATDDHALDSLPGLLSELVAAPSALAQMSDRAAALVDGSGVGRVVDAMRSQM